MDAEASGHGPAGSDRADPDGRPDLQNPRSTVSSEDDVFENLIGDQRCREP